LLGVLLFHADGLLPGGYLGVDLFFVLSGYLITSLLLAEHRATGRIDLYAFWVRRCRRLFPALLALMPAVAAYGWFFARPEELHTLRSQALASLGYVANWYAIFDHRSYWQLFSAPSPLEHTWSLSIEEQFYVIWPVLLVLTLRRYNARFVLLLSVLLTLVSMAAMVLLFSRGDSSRAYLGTDTRMSGILAGAALAVVVAPGSALPVWLTRWLDGLGAAAAVCLALACWRLGGTSPFLYHGGFWLTELGVLVLITCATLDRKSVVARLLSVRPLTWLGTISYGVYLWHWPVNVLLTAERSQLHGAPLQVLRLALSLGVAMLSYRFVERPIRQRGLPFGRPQYLVPAAVTLAVLLIVHATYARAGSTAARTEASGNVSGLELARYRVVVFGDSTANSLGWGLRALHEKDMAVELFGKDGCSMLSGRCDGEQWAERVRALRPDVTLVYLAGAFLYGFGRDGGWHTACFADWDAKFEQSLTRGLQDLEKTRGSVFVATAPYPAGRWDTLEYRKQIDCINASLRKAAAQAPSVRILDLHDRICPTSTCQQDVPGHGPLRPDGVHFSIAGAEHVAGWVLAQIRR
jgi:peptidoglycan/LPS O-acetylase OafA/YrhL